ncbi:MAG: FecCD family ABC transporter permease [Sphingomonadales bacterium]
MNQHWLIPGLISAAIISVLAACFLGATPMAVGRIISALVRQGEQSDVTILWQIRLPRALAAFIVGAALGTSGAALQGLLRNPLAEPGILGVSASASLGATFVLYYGLAAVSAWVVPSAAILGALLATSLITFAAIRVRSVVTLILVGVGLSSFSGAMMTLLMNLAPNPFSLSDLINWMLGSVANRSFVDLAFVAPFLLAGFAILFTTKRGLTALTLGEEAASGIGLDIKRQRILVVLGAGLLSGAAVAVAGAIGFVGIIAPHVVRPFVDYDPARTLLPSALLAGVILVIADVAVRLAPTSNELKLGVVAALIGAPAFVWIAMQRRAAAA